MEDAFLAEEQEILSGNFFVVLRWGEMGWEEFIASSLWLVEVGLKLNGQKFHVFERFLWFSPKGKAAITRPAKVIPPEGLSKMYFKSFVRRNESNRQFKSSHCILFSTNPSRDLLTKPARTRNLIFS